MNLDQLIFTWKGRFLVLVTEIYLFRDESSCIFNYFVLSPLVFLINFVTLPPSFPKTGLPSDNQFFLEIREKFIVWTGGR